MRDTPYVSKPSESLLRTLRVASDARLYVVQEPGPTSFVLKSADSERKHRVQIGAVHTCSCGAREQPCVHTAFVLLRIFRLDPSNPLVWQTSLIDSELERIIETRARTAAARRAQARSLAPPVSRAASAPTEAPLRAGEVPQREIDDENTEPCPICYEEIVPDDQRGEQRTRPPPPASPHLASPYSPSHAGDLIQRESSPSPRRRKARLVSAWLRQERPSPLHENLGRPPGVDRQAAHVPVLPVRLGAEPATRPADE